MRVVPPNVFFCQRCGDAYRMAMPCSLAVFAAAGKAYGREHKRCKQDKSRGLACTYCFRFGHRSTACQSLDCKGDPELWWQGPDTGTSSKVLCQTLAGWGQRIQGQHVPRDPADFGRCYRLLRAIPGWRERIGEMSAVPGWGGLAAAWDELEALYEEELPSGSGPKLYARMRELQRSEAEMKAY